MARSGILRRPSLNVFVWVFLALACGNNAARDTGNGGSGGAVGTSGNLARGGSAGTVGAQAGKGGSAGSATTAGGMGGIGGAGRAGATGGAPSGGSAGTVLAAGTGGSSQAGAPATGGADGAGQGGVAGGAAGQSSAGGAGVSGPAGAGGGGGSGGKVGNGTLKIVTIGDSTTQSTCWRALLWQTLNTPHSGHFDFVGSHKEDSACAPSGYDQDAEAYGGSLLTQAVSGTFTNPSKTCSPTATSTGNCPALVDFTNAFNGYKADAALIYYGTNDVWENKSPDDLTAGYGKLVDGLRAANASVRVFIAKETPLSAAQCSACGTTVPALNDKIAAWAPTKSTSQSPVSVVDLFTGFDATADTKDGVHPNDTGSAKIAAKWDAVLEPLF